MWGSQIPSRSTGWRSRQKGEAVAIPHLVQCLAGHIAESHINHRLGESEDQDQGIGTMQLSVAS
jgi:hypothetical protein